jgi:hypothetical protein
MNHRAQAVAESTVSGLKKRRVTATIVSINARL